MIESTSTEQLALFVANLDCQNDARKLRSGIAGVLGLTAVEIAPQQARVTLSYDPQRTTPEMLKAALAGVGFPERTVDGCECEVALPKVSGPEAARLRRFAGWLTALTIAWNVIEGIVSVASGVVAGSIALVGFGLDSFMEVSSALVIAWRLARHGEDDDANERAEKRAVRLIAGIFFAIAVYVAYDSVTKLLGISEEPERSPVGLAITALSMVVMPALAWGKRRVAGRLGSVALKADSAQTQLCFYLSIVVFVGLGANALFGWWWMDPIAGLCVAALAAREGRDAWTSGELCEC